MCVLSLLVLLSFVPTGAAIAKSPIPLDPGAGGRSIGTAALKPGDIIVTTTRGGVSRVIRDATNAPVSHAMIYVGNGTFVEAVLNGVRLVGFEKALKGATLAVAFHHPQLDRNSARKVTEFAKRQATLRKKYNLKGLGQQFLCYRRGVLCFYPSAGKKWYCSELVLAAYRNAGLRVLLRRTGKQAPGELTKNSVLKYVGHLLTPVNRAKRR